MRDAGELTQRVGKALGEAGYCGIEVTQRGLRLEANAAGFRALGQLFLGLAAELTESTPRGAEYHLREFVPVSAVRRGQVRLRSGFAASEPGQWLDVLLAKVDGVPAEPAWCLGQDVLTDFEASVALGWLDSLTGLSLQEVERRLDTVATRSQPGSEGGLAVLPLGKSAMAELWLDDDDVVRSVALSEAGQDG